MADEEKICIFCAIVEGKVPAKRVYEDTDSIAFLDINPRAKGMTIVVPKKHYSLIQNDYLESLKSFQAAENISQMIITSLGAKTVEIAVMPSQEVPHFHFRLYPIYENESPIMEEKPFKMKDEELDSIANIIKSAKADIFSQTPKKEESEKSWSEEDASYIKKQLDRA